MDPQEYYEAVMKYVDEMFDCSGKEVVCYTCDGKVKHIKAIMDSREVGDPYRPLQGICMPYDYIFAGDEIVDDKQRRYIVKQVGTENVNDFPTIRKFWYEEKDVSIITGRKYYKKKNGESSG